MNIDFNKLFPTDPSIFEGFQFVRIVAVLLLLLVVVRSCIHLFASDGGAQRIAGIDTSVEGGKNIIAMFHQWGAIQLILGVLLIVLFFRYPGRSTQWRCVCHCGVPLCRLIDELTNLSMLVTTE
jgi:hypothetical protein